MGGKGGAELRSAAGAGIIKARKESAMGGFSGAVRREGPMRSMSAMARAWAGKAFAKEPRRVLTEGARGARGRRL